MAIKIDPAKCTGDGICVDVCPTGVIEMKDGKAVPTNNDACIDCENCVNVCESNAIKMA